jgi:outer membrane protein TolC
MPQPSRLYQRSRQTGTSSRHSAGGRAGLRAPQLITAALLTGLWPAAPPASPGAAIPPPSPGLAAPGTAVTPSGPTPVPAAPGSALPPLTLAGAVTAAMTTHPTARAATQQLAQAQARLAQAQAQRRFQITLDTTGGGSNADVIQPPPAHETFGSLQNTLTVPLPIGARPRLAIEQARAELDAAQALYDSARLSLTQDVSTAYYDLLRKQALLQIAQETLAAAQRQLSEAQRRLTAGDVAQLDVLRAQVPVASAQAGLYQAETAAAVARQTLNSLVGQPLDAALVVAEVPPAVITLPFTLDEARSLALQYSPQLRAAAATARADEAALRSARRWREPALSLQAIDLRSGDKTSFSREDTIQASLTIPLSDGGVGRARTREAKAALEQARAQAEAARRTLLVTVSSAYLIASSSSRQVAAAQVAQEIAQISYDKTVLGYRNGLFPFTDVLNAQAALTQSRIAYRQALYDAAVAISTLDNAIGRTGPGSGVP